MKSREHMAHQTLQISAPARFNMVGVNVRASDQAALACRMHHRVLFQPLPESLLIAKVVTDYDLICTVSVEF